MKRIKFVIYGAGYRGRKLLEYMGAENVEAFIDSDNKKIGKFFCQKQVISLDEYENKYDDCFIIISAACPNLIIRELMQKKVFQFTLGIDMPSEFNLNSYCKFEECYKDLKDKGKEYVLYGLNAFSLMLYEYLWTNSKVCIIATDSDNEIVCWLRNNYPDIVLKEINNISGTEEILITTRQIASADLRMLENNAKINMLKYSNDLPVYYHKELEKFRNIFQGRKRCFITATGPSMNINDLEMLRKNDEFCIAVNSMCLLKSIWKPDVFVVVDGIFWENHKEDILNCNSDMIFLPDDFEILGNKYKNIYLFHRVIQYQSEESENMTFSEDICQKIYNGATVTFVCIQLAVYLGFKEIYLLGVDCNYVQKSSNNHFISDQKGDFFSYRYENNEVENGMLIGYRIAKKYADTHNIKIYNATRGGKLEVFERVDFDSLF